MTRYLGIDHGTKRIGLAVGDGAGRLATPVQTVHAGGEPRGQVRAVLSAAEQYHIDAFVIGLPLNMDGTEGSQARLTRAFGALLGEADPRPVHYFDERLTSHAAADALRSTGQSRRKRAAREDSVAAQMMLQAFLDDPHSRTGLDPPSTLDEPRGAP
jgi:putative Holliday junction resolvase